MGNKSGASSGVSTHSRLKAAGRLGHTTTRIKKCFNTQPPEGGWADSGKFLNLRNCFNTQPPEGGWVTHRAVAAKTDMFQHTAA